MKSLKLRPGKFPSVIRLPGSKSYANRVLILAALKDDRFTITDLPESTDVTVLVDCLRQVGLDVRTSDSGCTISNSFPACETEGQEIFVGEGGTTARFLASLLLRGSKPYTLILGKRLKQRPWHEFIDLVSAHGGKISLEGEKLSLQGPVSFPNELEVDCSRTTQFASGIQLVYPETKVIPKNLETSQSYWSMTQFLQDEIKKTSSFSVPLDWSSASYPLAFAAIQQEIQFPGLFFDRFQADAKFNSTLETLGFSNMTPVGLTVSPRAIEKDIELDVSDCLDLVPALGFFLAHIPGRHTLRGVENLKHKESDRLQEVMKLLSTFHRATEAAEDSLIIHGSTQKISRPVDLVLPDDHRMVMAGALFLLHHSGGSLSPSEAVAKSYPRFFQLLEGFCDPESFVEP